MKENRRVRFATIEGIERSDLPLAAEVWLDNLTRQFWVTREFLKLAALFTRYMADPQPESLILTNVERACQMDAKQTLEALRLMQIYGAVEAYSSEDKTLSVSLNLSLLLRLRVLETRQRFAELRSAPRLETPPLPAKPEDKWRPRRLADRLDGAVGSGT